MEVDLTTAERELAEAFASEPDWYLRTMRHTDRMWISNQTFVIIKAAAHYELARREREREREKTTIR